MLPVELMLRHPYPSVSLTHGILVNRSIVKSCLRVQSNTNSHQIHSEGTSFSFCFLYQRQFSITQCSVYTPFAPPAAHMPNSINMSHKNGTEHRKPAFIDLTLFTLHTLHCSSVVGFTGGALNARS